MDNHKREIYTKWNNLNDFDKNIYKQKYQKFWENYKIEFENNEKVIKKNQNYFSSYNKFK